MMEVSLLRIAEEMKKWSDEKCACTASKLIKLSETIGAECIRIYDYDIDEFCVLNHGDCWINNIMFKENEKGQPVELLLVMCLPMPICLRMSYVCVCAYIVSIVQSVQNIFRNFHIEIDRHSKHKYKL